MVLLPADDDVCFNDGKSISAEQNFIRGDICVRYWTVYILYTLTKFVELTTAQKR